MREVDWRLRAILNRNNLEKAFDAQVHDKELKLPRVKKEKNVEIKVTKEQEDAMAKAIEAAKLRKAREYGTSK